MIYRYWIILGVVFLAYAESTSLWKTKQNTNNKITKRFIRAARGLARGQTQSQYLNFGKPEEEGKAEAEANEQGSRAFVTGTHGMGQAQSQFSSVDCRPCFPTLGDIEEDKLDPYQINGDSYDHLTIPSSTLNNMQRIPAQHNKLSGTISPQSKDYVSTHHPDKLIAKDPNESYGKTEQAFLPIVPSVSSTSTLPSSINGQQKPGFYQPIPSENKIVLSLPQSKYDQSLYPEKNKPTPLNKQIEDEKLPHRIFPGKSDKSTIIKPKISAGDYSTYHPGVQTTATQKNTNGIEPPIISANPDSRSKYHKHPQHIERDQWNRQKVPPISESLRPNLDNTLKDNLKYPFNHISEPSNDRRYISQPTDFQTSPLNISYGRGSLPQSEKSTKQPQSGSPNNGSIQLNPISQQSPGTDKKITISPPKDSRGSLQSFSPTSHSGNPEKPYNSRFLDDRSQKPPHSSPNLPSHTSPSGDSKKMNHASDPLSHYTKIYPDGTHVLTLPGNDHTLIGPERGLTVLVGSGGPHQTVITDRHPDSSGLQIIPGSSTSGGPKQTVYTPAGGLTVLVGTGGPTQTVHNLPLLTEKDYNSKTIGSSSLSLAQPQDGSIYDKSIQATVRPQSVQGSAVQDIPIQYLPQQSIDSKNRPLNLQKLPGQADNSFPGGAYYPPSTTHTRQHFANQPFDELNKKGQGQGYSLPSGTQIPDQTTGVIPMQFGSNKDKQLASGSHEYTPPTEGSTFIQSNGQLPTNSQSSIIPAQDGTYIPVQPGKKYTGESPNIMTSIQGGTYTPAQISGQFPNGGQYSVTPTQSKVQPSGESQVKYPTGTQHTITPTQNHAYIPGQSSGQLSSGNHYAKLPTQSELQSTGQSSAQYPGGDAQMINAAKNGGFIQGQSNGMLPTANQHSMIPTQMGFQSPGQSSGQYPGGSPQTIASTQGGTYLPQQFPSGNQQSLIPTQGGFQPQSPTGGNSQNIIPTQDSVYIPPQNSRQFPSGSQYPTIPTQRELQPTSQSSPQYPSGISHNIASTQSEADLPGQINGRFPIGNQYSTIPAHGGGIPPLGQSNSNPQTITSTHGKVNTPEQISSQFPNRNQYLINPTQGGSQPPANSNGQYPNVVSNAPDGFYMPRQSYGQLPIERQYPTYPGYQNPEQLGAQNPPTTTSIDGGTHIARQNNGQLPNGSQYSTMPSQGGQYLGGSPQTTQNGAYMPQNNERPYYGSNTFNGNQPLTGNMGQISQGRFIPIIDSHYPQESTASKIYSSPGASPGFVNHENLGFQHKPTVQQIPERKQPNFQDPYHKQVQLTGSAYQPIAENQGGITFDPSIHSSRPAESPITYYGAPSFSQSPREQKLQQHPGSPALQAYAPGYYFPQQISGYHESAPTGGSRSPDNGFGGGVLLHPGSILPSTSRNSLPPLDNTGSSGSPQQYYSRNGNPSVDSTGSKFQPDYKVSGPGLLRIPEFGSGTLIPPPSIPSNNENIRGGIREIGNSFPIRDSLPSRHQTNGGMQPGSLSPTMPSETSELKPGKSETDIQIPNNLAIEQKQVKSDIEADDSFSQAESSVKNGQAQASAQGKKNGGTTQTQVSGTYTGTGSFSASAMSSDNDRSANSQVSGTPEGAMSSAQGQGGSGKSQSQVNVNSKTGGTVASSQGSGINHQSQSEVQANEKGGLADAQSSGPGQTSSQAQIGFKPQTDQEENDKEVFNGGGQASAQSGSLSGQSQAQIHGNFKYGISYHGAAQSASGTKEQVATYREKNKSLFQTITEFGSPNRDGISQKVDSNYGLSSQSHDTDRSNSIFHSLTRDKAKPLEDDTGNNSDNDFRLRASEKDNEEKDAVKKQDEDIEYEEDFEYDEEDYSQENPDIDESKSKLINTDKASSDSDKINDFIKNESLDIITTTVNSNILDTSKIFSQNSPTQKQQISIKNPNDNFSIVQKQNGHTIYYPKTTTEKIPDGFRGTINTEKKFHTKFLPSRHGHKSNNITNGKFKSPKSYVTVTKSVTGSLDTSKNPPVENKNFASTYYTKSSTCGYFTFSCNIVYGANGRSKICRPKAPTNGKC